MLIKRSGIISLWNQLKRRLNNIWAEKNFERRRQFEEVYTGRTGFSCRSAVFGGSDASSSDLQLRGHLPAVCGGARSWGGGGGVQVLSHEFLLLVKSCCNPPDLGLLLGICLVLVDKMSTWNIWSIKINYIVGSGYLSPFYEMLKWYLLGLPKYQKAVLSLLSMIWCLLKSLKRLDTMTIFQWSSAGSKKFFSLFGDNLVCLGAGSGREGQGKLTEWLQRWWRDQQPQLLQLSGESSLFLAKQKIITLCPHLGTFWSRQNICPMTQSDREKVMNGFGETMEKQLLQPDMDQLFLEECF